MGGSVAPHPDPRLIAPPSPPGQACTTCTYAVAGQSQLSPSPLAALLCRRRPQGRHCHCKPHCMLGTSPLGFNTDVRHLCPCMRHASTPLSAWQARPTPGPACEPPSPRPPRCRALRLARLAHCLDPSQSPPSTLQGTAFGPARTLLGALPVPALHAAGHCVWPGPHTAWGPPNPLPQRCRALRSARPARPFPRACPPAGRRRPSRP